MSAADDSQTDTTSPSPGNAPSSAAPAAAEIWLDGDVLSCACPDCGGPMSIRLWLMVADCFRCGASVELTAEQEREALRLLRQQEETRQVEAQQTQAAMAAVKHSLARKPKAATAASRPAPVQPANPPATTPTVTPIAEPAPVSRSLPPPLSHREPVAEKPRAAASPHPSRPIDHQAWLREFWKNLPAWLISLIVHLVLVLLLGLHMVEAEAEDPAITLATSLSYQDVEGGLFEPEVVPDATEFDKPGERESQEAERQSVGDDLQAELATLDIPDPLGSVPELNELVRALPSAALGSMYAGRDPRLRAMIAQQEGGTTLTEAAVTRGLRWLARHQNEDGSWSLDAFHLAPAAQGPPDGLGGPSDVAATSMAILPFLGAGETQQHGQYRNLVANGLRWLVKTQKRNGDLRGTGIGRMYAHGQAAIVLCEAYAMTRDEQLREPAQRALDFIVKAQHSAGGWRYAPKEPGDTSVVGWQLMALKSGVMGYLIVPDRTFRDAGYFLDSVQVDDDGSQYGYRPHSAASAAMTAEALLCRQYLGWPKDHPGLQAGAEFLLREYPPDVEDPHIYYWYYGTQVMHHLGGELWQRWNSLMRNILVEMQVVTGPHAGSWDPDGPWSGDGGRIFMTSLAICSLEVYYRHQPLYHQSVLQGLDQGGGDERQSGER